MSTKPVFLTPEGRKKLEEELDHLRTVRRPQVALRIHLAKEDGDITENAGYDEAKNEQAFLEGRIATLEAMLSNAVLIEETGSSEAVVLGSRVTLKEEGGGQEAYRIVGWAEADPEKGLISDESPLGQALLGHGMGEEVAVHTPDGVRPLVILEIR